MKKNKQIHLYFTEHDYNIVKETAKSRGMNTNEFIRYCCAYVIDNTYIRDYKND